MGICKKLISKLRNYLITRTRYCIIVKKCELDYEAFLENDKNVYGQGNSPSMAVYDLLNMNMSDNDLPEIVYHKTKWDSR